MTSSFSSSRAETGRGVAPGEHVRPLRAGPALTMAVALATLTACAARSATNAGAVTGAGSESAADIRVGDCATLPSQLEGSDVVMIHSLRVVPCAQSHDLEAYLTFEVPGEEFPGDDAVALLTDEQCYEAFSDFVGLSYEESEFDYITLSPTSESWALGDRSGTCLIVHPTDRIEGSLGGAMR